MVGVARCASFIAALQPRHSLAADVDWLAVFVCVLDVASHCGLPARNDSHVTGDQLAVPILDPHGTGEKYGPAGVGAEYAVTPSSPSCVEPTVSGQESRRHAHHLGPPVWLVCAGTRALYLWAHEEHPDLQSCKDRLS